VTAERRTLLHIAAGQGHCGLITELARRDRDLLSSLTSSQDTPLHFAARAGHADAVAVIVRLIASREDDDDSDDDVEEAWRRLRLRGVHDVLGAKNRAGDTALHVAARHGRGAAAAVEALMRLAPGLAAELNGAGVSPLYLAVVSGSVRAVAAIVAYGDDAAAAAGSMSQNALHAAVLQSSGQFVHSLIFLFLVN
jgi:ankyrin repeat protein